MARSEVFALADELTLQLKDAKRIPFTDSVMINQESTIDKIKRIIAAYDPAIDSAQKIIDNEEHIIVDAQHKADETMQQARAEAQGMVSEANNYAQSTKQEADEYRAQLRKSAEDEANAYVADAQARAQNMIEDAKAQADEMVSKTTVLARAEEQARELLDNANQHAQELRKQTQMEVDGILAHVDSTIAAQLNELRLIRQNIAGAGYETVENK